MAKHPYIDTSHVPDFIDDRGPAEYFHGRKRILGNFNKLAKKSIETQGGSTFLIQGAPGAGKTALLHECEKMVKIQGWKVVKIKAPALWDPYKLLDALGRGEKYKGTEKITQIGFRGLVHWVWKSIRPQPSVESVLKALKKPLLLVLDEAQRLAPTKNHPREELGNAGDLLETIHNGELNKPVILLAAGLGPTKAAFGDLGISRFRGGCFIELGALSKESERAVIRDWLIKEGGAKGDPTAWMDAIAQQTHGWPQHIAAYGDAAAQQIKHDKGAMTSAGLEVVYQVGMKRRKAYYKQRVEGFDGNELACLYEALAGIELGIPFNEDLILGPLNKKYGSERAEKIFKKIIDKGILSLVRGLYSVPIPSMHDWMKSELEWIQEALHRAEAAQNRDAAPKSIGPRRDVSSSTTTEPEERTTPNPHAPSKEDQNPPKDRSSNFDIER